MSFCLDWPAKTLHPKPLLFVLFAFITGNSSSEHLFEGLFAQIHTDLS